MDINTARRAIVDRLPQGAIDALTVGVKPEFVRSVEVEWNSGGANRGTRIPDDTSNMEAA